MIFQIKVLSILKIMSLNLSSESLLKEQRGRVRIFFPLYSYNQYFKYNPKFYLDCI